MIDRRRGLALLALAILAALVLLWEGDAAHVRTDGEQQAAAVSRAMEVGATETPSPILDRAEDPATRAFGAPAGWSGAQSKKGVRVRVFAHDGAPAEGVHVAAIRVDQDWMEALEWPSVTGADGRALVTATVPSPDERPDRYRIVAAIPLQAPCESLLTWDNYADEHVLTLPPTGRVEVRLRDGLGAPFLGRAFPSLRHHDPSEEAAESNTGFEFYSEPELGGVSNPAEAGVATFPWVGLGLTLDACGYAFTEQDPVLRGIPGPLHENETVTIELRDLPILTFVEIPVLGPDGAPLRGERVRSSSLPYASGFWSEGGVTDVDGILSIPVDPEPGRGGAAYLFAREFGAETPWGAEWKPPALVTKNRMRLPPVRLAEVPILAAGQVVRADGAPEPSAELTLLMRPKPEWDWMHADQLPLNRDASFRLHGFQSEFAYHLWANREWRHGSADLRPGALDHRIELPPDEQRPAWVEWDDPSWIRLARIQFGTLPLTPEQDSTFRIDFKDDAAPVEVRDELTGELLAGVPDVVPAWEQERLDPRLRPLDLRGKVRKIRVVWDRSRKEIPLWSLTLDPPADEWPDFTYVDDRAVEFLTVRPTVNLWLQAEGFRPRRYEDVRGEIEAQLEPGIRVTVQLQDRAVLDVAPWVGCVFFTEGASRFVDDQLLGYRFDPDGLATAWLPAPGEYDIHLELSSSPTSRFGDYTTLLDSVSWIATDTQDAVVTLEAKLEEARAAWRAATE